jgi:hypothetical protein
MSKKYIPQTPNNDFVYPNNDRVEYDVTIVHDINDNCPTGTISGVTITNNAITPANIDISYYYMWQLNGATPFKRQSGNISILSVHMMLPNQDYFKPWRMVDSISNSSPTTTEQYGTRNATDISPSDFGVSSFPNGDYKFEFRLIGEECVEVICAEASLVGPTPTPIPPTPTGPTATPTPTQTETPTPTPSPTAVCSLTTIPDSAFISVGSSQSYTSLGGYCITDEFSQDYGEFYIDTGSSYIPDIYAWEGAAGSTTCYTPTGPYGSQVLSFTYNGGVLYPLGGNTLYDSGTNYSYGGCTYDVITEWTGPTLSYVHLCPQ